MSSQQASDLLKDVSTHLINRPVTGSNFTCINLEKGMYCCNIERDEDRKKYLRESHKLKGTRQYDKVYVHRDLTYNQRQELQLRRARNAPTDGAATDNTHPPADTSSADPSPTQTPLNI